MIRAFQRHCNFSSNSHNKPRPSWFDREKIFDSFILTLDDRVDYIAFHDSGNGEIDDHFLNHKNVNKISKTGGNDAQSFLNLLNYVIEQNYDDDDIIYLIEDDYLHHPGWPIILQDAFDSFSNIDYVTLYDHPNKYLPIYQVQSTILTSKYTHWRTTQSTTNTYACKFKTLKQHFNIHVQYCDLTAKWTKDHDKFTHLWNIGSNLISCIPGYSTHVEENMLAPFIDWQSIL